MDNASKWGALKPLAEEVTKKKIDGFEIPFELVNFVDDEWPNGGGPVVRYTTPQGILLFREGMYEAYGFLSAKEFASAAKKNALRVKTVEGAISVGRTRAISLKPYYILLAHKELCSDMRFLAETTEEALKMRDFLRDIYPEANIGITENIYKWALTKAFSLNIFDAIKGFHTLLPRQKKAIFILLGIGIATIVLAVITPFKIVPSGLDILSFILLMIALFSLLPYLSPDSILNKKPENPDQAPETKQQ